MADHQYNAQVIRLGIPDDFVDHGEQAELWAICGYDTSSIIKTIKKIAVGRTTETMAS
ncbi:1-deoxy-D-xylulose-5-phosphate synthase [compost metagenome]